MPGLSDEEALALDGPPSVKRGLSDEEALALDSGAQSKAPENMSFGDYVSASLPFGKDVGALGAAAGAATADVLKGNAPQWRWGSERAKIEQQLQAYEKKHPVLSTVGDIAGAALAGPAADAAIPETLMGRMGQAAKSGSLLGGLYGAGTSDGDMGDRALAGAAGMAGGAAIGAAGVPVVEKVLAPAANAVGRGVGSAWNAVKAPFTEEGRDKIAGRLLSALAPGAEDQMASVPLPGMKVGPGQAANDPRLLALQKSATAINQSAAMLGEQNRATNNAVIRDAIGQLGDTGADASATMQQRIAAIADPGGARERVAQDLNESLGVKGEDFYASKDELDAVRKADARPLYNEAYAAPAVNPDEMERTGAIGNLLPRPSMKVGVANAQKLASEEGVDPNTWGIKFNDAGDVIFTKVPTWQTLDYIKRGVSQVVEDSHVLNPNGKVTLTNYGRLANQTLMDLSDNLRMMNPALGEAWDNWSGPTQSMKAMNMGLNVLKQDPEVTAQTIAKLPAGDKQYFRIGAAKAIQDMLSRPEEGLTAVQSVFKSPAARQKIAAAFPPDAFDAFMGRTAQEMSANPLIAKVLQTDAMGNMSYPASAVADQFIQSGRLKGSPEAFRSYLRTVGNDPEALGAARDAFAQKFLGAVQNSAKDIEGNQIVSAAKMTNFVNDYGHIINSPLFSPEQRSLVQSIAKASDMVNTINRGLPGGGSDTASKLAGSIYTGKYLDAMLGPRMSKLASVAGGYGAGAMTGIPGAGVVGAIAGGAGASTLERALYRAPQEKVVQILNVALHDSNVAKALMKKASAGSENSIPEPTKRYLWSVLAAPAAGDAAARKAK